MDCISCQKCDTLGIHSWRFQCTHCQCPKYLHNSYVQQFIQDSQHCINWIDDLSSTKESQFLDYKIAMKMAKSENLLWLPIGLDETQITDFLDAYDTQLGLQQSKSNKLKREMNISSQIPLGDCSITSASVPDEIKLGDSFHSETTFKNRRDSSSLGFGRVDVVNTSESCLGCKMKFVDCDTFSARITHSDFASWHISCFQCYQCRQTLVDFHYYWSVENQNIYCMKHFDELTVSRCGGCDQLIFEKDYTKAMQKDYHMEHFACKECDKTLTGGKFIIKDDSSLCLKCYEIKFSNTCDRCSEKISCDSKDLTFNGRHWHDKCFLCDNCKESLADRSFATKEKDLYCPDCFDAKFAVRCSGCTLPFKAGSKKFEYAGNQWHEECFRCGECNESIGSKSFIPKNEKTLCVKCYEDKYAQKCSKCKEIIRKGGVTYKNEPWHKDCFLCVNCNKELAATKFTSRDDQPYCAECFAELFSKRCKKCEKPISSFGGCKFISLEEDHWHPECFSCSKCDVSLVGKGFMTHNLAIMCPICGESEINKE